MDNSDYFKRIDQSKLAPWFLSKVMQLQQNVLDKGAGFFAICGYRDPEEQDALYAIGRTVDTDKPPVTRAPAYKSYHNYGLAVDFCLDADATKPGLQPDYKKEHYQILADEAIKLGLAAGYYFESFPEGPHVQIPPTMAGVNTLEPILREKGLQAVWDFVASRPSRTTLFKKFWT